MRTSILLIFLLAACDDDRPKCLDALEAGVNQVLADQAAGVEVTPCVFSFENASRNALYCLAQNSAAVIEASDAYCVASASLGSEDDEEADALLCSPLQVGASKAAYQYRLGLEELSRCLAEK